MPKATVDDSAKEVGVLNLQENFLQFVRKNRRRNWSLLAGYLVIAVGVLAVLAVVVSGLLLYIIYYNRIDEDLNFFESMSYLSTSLGIAFAALGACYLLWRGIRDRRVADYQRAKDMYLAVMDDPATYEILYPMAWSDIPDKDFRAKYKFYFQVTKLLWACEEILRTGDQDKDAWMESIRVTIMDHHDYLRSMFFVKRRELDTYIHEMQLVIKFVIETVPEGKIQALTSLGWMNKKPEGGANA